VEFFGYRASLRDLTRYQLTQILEVDMSGDELRKGVGDGNNRLIKVGLGRAGRPPKGAGCRLGASLRGAMRAVWIVWHGVDSSVLT
jgi:hypothetical protein